MWFFSALKTVNCATGARDIVNLHDVGFFTEIWAPFVGAIADIFVLDGIVDANLFPVEFAEGRSNFIKETL